MGFRSFLENGESDDVAMTLQKLPNSHVQLVKNFRIKLISGNTLKGDDDHIGYMDKGPKEIVVASPWNYGRNFVLLHEIAHIIWTHKMTPELKKVWSNLLKHANLNINQSEEEIFASTYANTYADIKVVKYNHPQLINFIKNKLSN